MSGGRLSGYDRCLPRGNSFGGVGRVRTASRRALRQFRSGLTDVPGNELANDLSSVPDPRELPERLPQLLLNTDGAVRPVGRLQRGHHHAQTVRDGYPHRKNVDPSISRQTRLRGYPRSVSVWISTWISTAPT